MKKDLTPAPVNAENLQQWLEKITKTPKSSLILLFIIALIPTGMMIFSAHKTLQWDRRIAEWKQVEGTILKNNPKRVRSNGKNRTVAEFEYKYRYDNFIFYGNAITYGKSSLPSNIRPGSRYPIIVNPANPSQSAALARYQANNFALLLKYLDIIIFGIFSVIIWTALVINLRRVKAYIPEKLYQYIKQTDDGTIKELTGECADLYFAPFAPILKSGVYYPRADYFYIKTGNRKIFQIIFSLLFIQFGITAYFSPVMLIPAIGTLIVLYSERNSKIIFDMEKKRIIRSRKLHPQNIKDKYKIDLDSIRCFALKNVYASQKRGGYMLTLFAISKDNKAIPIVKISPKKATVMLEFIAEVFPLIGNYPILFPDTK